MDKKRRIREELKKGFFLFHVKKIETSEEKKSTVGFSGLGEGGGLKGGAWL